MMKLFRYLVFGLGAVIVLLIAVVAIFVAVFDANAYKEDMSRLVQEQTGRELRFQGDVELTFFPALGMRLGAMSFANAPGFGELPMLSIREASISVDVVSLLWFAPEIDKLTLHDLEINLIRNKVGVNNWDDLLAKNIDGGTSGSTIGKSTSEAGTKPAASEFELKGAFAGLDIENLKLLWLDEQAGEQYQVTDLDISTGRIAPNESFPLTLHVDANTAAEGDVSIDLEAVVEYLIDQQRLSLNQLTLGLNEFVISGQLQVRNFAKPALRFDLSSPELDVDALLGTPPAKPDALPAKPGKNKQSVSGEGGDGAADESTASDTQIKLPMQVLRDLDIEGQLRITKVKVQNLKLQDVDLRVNAQNGLVALKPMKLNAYGGQIVANVVVDVTGDLPKYGVGKSIKNLQVGKLLKDYMGEAPISGNLSAEMNLATRGEWVSKLKRNSNGTMQLSFLDGALNGFNIRHLINVAKAKLKGDDPPPEEAQKTDFASLTIGGVVRNGVFSSDDLDLQAPLLRAGGKGTANLNSEVGDYLMNAKLVGTLKGQQGDSADQLAGLPIPIRIKGPFAKPEIDVQLDEMLKARVDAEKEKLKSEFALQKKQLEAQLKAELKALEKARKRELKKKMEVEQARAEEKARKMLEELLGN
jgi:AsmA protein